MNRLVPHTETYGYDMIRAIRTMLSANNPSTFDRWSAAEIVAACEACDQAGEMGCATPMRVSECTIEWMCDDVCVASYTVSEQPGGPGVAWVFEGWKRHDSKG